MKETTLEDIKKEELEFARGQVKNRFVEPSQQVAGYESIKIELIYNPNYKDFINAAYYVALTTWDQTGSDLVSSESLEEREEIVKYMLKKRQISAIMEMPVFVFRMTGVPRSMTHQIVRHRTMSFSQQSFRVSSCYPDPVRLPNNLSDNLKLKYIKSVENIRDLYREMINNGISMEQARNIMPMGTTTKIIMVTNFKSLKDYVKARTLNIAQDEHTYITELILKELEYKSYGFYELLVNL